MLFLYQTYISSSVSINPYALRVYLGSAAGAKWQLYEWKWRTPDLPKNVVHRLREQNATVKTAIVPHKAGRSVASGVFTQQILVKYKGWEGDLEDRYLTYSQKFISLTLLVQSDV